MILWSGWHAGRGRNHTPKRRTEAASKPTLTCGCEDRPLRQLNGGTARMAAASMALLLDFQQAFARIQVLGSRNDQRFPLEMDMSMTTRARSIVIATVLFATAFAAGP